MAHIPLSDDVCDRRVASWDPIVVERLHDEAVAAASRRLRDELLAELAREPSAGPAAAPSRSRRRRRRGWGATPRRMAAGVALAAVVVGALAMVGWLPGGEDHSGPLEVPAASAAVVLERAAQAALRSTSVVPGHGQYGFVKVQTGSVLGQGQDGWSAWVRMAQTKSDWYTANGAGRERIVRTSTAFLTPRDRATARAHGVTLTHLTATFPRVVDGAFPARTLQTAGFLPYWEMNRLPTRPAALRRAIDRLILASAGKSGQASLSRQLRADPAGLFAPISQFLFLPTSPRLRAALFRVLAGLPGVHLLGHRRDRLGRSGVAVAVTDGRPDRVREELLFDPATSNVLQTEAVLVRAHPTSAARAGSVPMLVPGTVLEYTDYLGRGVVSSITQLPGGRRLPLKPTSGNR